MTTKRAIVLVLALGLAGLGVYGWLSGTATPQVLGFIALGVVLAVTFLFRGSLPDVIHRYGSIERDDDPGNVPPRVYLPIVLLALLIAAVLLIWTLGQ